jgi:Predicted permease, DMT superfamily
VRGEIFIVTAALLWSTIGIAGALSYSCGGDVMQLPALRALFGFLIGLPVVKLRFLDKRYVIMGFLFTGPLFISYQISAAVLGVGTAAFLLYTAPVIVSLVSVPVLKEKISLKRGISIIMALIGVFLLEDPSKINIIGIIPALSYSGIIVYSRKLVSAGADPMDVGIAPLLWAALEGALVSGFSMTRITFCSVIVSIYLGAFTALLPYVLYSKGLKTIEASRASIISTLEPLFATLLGFLILGQMISMKGIVGGIIIVLAAMLSMRK